MAIIFSSLAALTGILAVGTGRHWRFSSRDILRGKRNAILYLWVTTSTIFSMLHSGMLMETGVTRNWVTGDWVSVKWMVLHAAIGALLVLAHLFVATTLSRQIGPQDRYLWGSKRHVQ